MGILYVPSPRSFGNDYYWCNSHHKYVYILLYQNLTVLRKVYIFSFLLQEVYKTQVLQHHLVDGLAIQLLTIPGWCLLS